MQFALMATIPVIGYLGPDWPESVSFELGVAGVLSATLGAAIVVVAARALGPGFTPFPWPKERAELVQGGLYRAARHPIYSGGILFFTGISLDASPLALGGTALLALVWALKARVEERFLADRYPAYADYCRRTRYRLVPFVY